MSGVESLSPQTELGRRAAARPVFGIKAKLFLAFCGMAALTAIAAAVAWYAFVYIDRSVTRITADSMPEMMASLRLAEKSAEIAATAPALIDADDQVSGGVGSASISARAEAASGPTVQVDKRIAVRIP